MSLVRDVDQAGNVLYTYAGSSTIAAGGKDLQVVSILPYLSPLSPPAFPRLAIGYPSIQS